MAPHEVRIASMTCVLLPEFHEPVNCVQEVEEKLLEVANVASVVPEVLEIRKATVQGLL